MTVNGQDLRAPLVLTYERYVTYNGRPDQLPCIHGIGGRPKCGSLHNVDPSVLEPVGVAFVRHLFATESADDRRVWFCQNCVASDSHPNQFPYNQQMERLFTTC